MTEKKGTKKPRKRSSAFGAALVEAERKLAKAIDELNECATRYHAISAEIPRLQMTVKALRNQQSVIPAASMGQTQYAPVPMGYSIEQAISDAPIPMRPPVVDEAGMIPLPEMPQMPRPPKPMGGGGAIGLTLEEPEDEDRFLKEAQLPGGEWR